MLGKKAVLSVDDVLFAELSESEGHLAGIVPRFWFREKPPSFDNIVEGLEVIGRVPPSCRVPSGCRSCPCH